MQPENQETNKEKKNNSKEKKNNNTHFHPLRELLWPIHSWETKQFISMALMMFFVVLNYTILRNSKDAIINTAPLSGAEVLSFLKGWVVMPCAILFVIGYSKLANLLERDTLFYLIIGYFLLFFACFNWVLYPLKEYIHLSRETMINLQTKYPNLRWVFPVFGNWSFSLFYLNAELWGTVVITIFWQFANATTPTKQAKRFYAMFILVSNLATIIAGKMGKSFASASSDSTWQSTQSGIIITFIISCISIILFYSYINNKVLVGPAHTKIAREKKQKTKLTISESFKYMSKSKEIRHIGIKVICYGTYINLIEAVWKSQIAILYPDTKQNYYFMATLSEYTGYTTIILIFLTKKILHKFNWFTAAIITPLTMLVTGSLFLIFVLFQKTLEPITLQVFGVSATFCSVWIGLVQNSVGKGTKYSLFDPTKEMAYIPLDPELKTKGKAAVDVIGGRLGKASGGYIQQILLISTAGTITTITPFLAGISTFIMIAWIRSVKKLSKLYEVNIAKKHQEEEKLSIISETS